jgi:hypothetical protein
LEGWRVLIFCYQKNKISTFRTGLIVSQKRGISTILPAAQGKKFIYNKLYDLTGFCSKKKPNHSNFLLSVFGFDVKNTVPQNLKYGRTVHQAFRFS